MKWLTRIGQILVTATKLITGLSPLIPNLSGTALVKIEDTLTKLVELVINVEAFGQVLSVGGPDKLKASVPVATQIILKSDAMIGKKIDDPILFTKGVMSVISGIADILNSLKDDIQTESIR